MALVSVGFEMTVQLVDTSGSSSILTYNLTSADYATALTDGATLRNRLIAITKSQVAKYRIIEVFEEDAFALPADAENVIKAEVSAYLDGFATKSASFRIPAPIDGLFVSGTGSGYNVVDLADTALIAYASSFEVGGIATISDGEAFKNPVEDNFNGGRRVSVGSRNP